MKKTLLSVTVFILSLCITSTSFAQGDTGGSAGASVTVAIQPTAIHFTRNNGDGTLPALAQIKMYYSTAPTVAPVLTEIYYNGLPLFANFSPVTGDISNYASTGYVTFSIPTSNIPPAIKLTLTYRPSYAQTEASISGTD
jgi:hypothetical protein